MSGDSQASTDFAMDQTINNEDLLNSTMLPANEVADPSSINKLKNRNDCDNIV